MYNRPHLLQLTHHELIVFSSVAPCRIWAHSVDQKMGFVCIFLSECLCRAEELDLNSARPFQMNGVYSVKSSIFLGSAANYDSASSCIISSTWSGSCSPMAPLLWTILGSPEHLQIWRSLWGKSKKNMASRPKVSSTCDIDPNVPCLGLDSSWILRFVGWTERS